MDCPIPEDVDAHTVVENIYQGLYESGYRFPPHVFAYGDVPEMASGAFATVGLPMIHVPAGTKGACRKAILVDFIQEAIGLTINQGSEFQLSKRYGFGQAYLMEESLSKTKKKSLVQF